MLNLCTIPPLPASAYTSLSAIPFPITPPSAPNDIEIFYAFYRAIRSVEMAAGGGNQWPPGNFPVFAGTITDISVDSSGIVTIIDSAANFSTPTRCGISQEINGCFVEIFYKDDPRWVPKANLSSSTTTTLTTVAQDWIARGQCVSLADLVGSTYAVYAGGDMSSYDRWIEPPNSMEYVGCPTFGAQGLPGSTAYFPTQKLTYTGPATAGTFTLTVSTDTGGASGTTANIAFNASATDIQSAIAALSNVGAGKITVIPYLGQFALCFDIALHTVTVTADSSGLTGGSITISSLSSILLDPTQKWATNQWITAQPTYPDNPTAFDLMLWDNASGGDGMVHRLSIVSNDATSITFTPISGFNPQQAAYFSIVSQGGYWSPKALSGPRKVWYRGAYHDQGVTHWPVDDSLGQYQQPAPTVSFVPGISTPDPCGAEVATDAFDTDVWNTCCEDDCCSKGNMNYSPDLYKTWRGIQIAIIALCTTPWVDASWGTMYGPGGAAPSGEPDTNYFPIAARAIHAGLVPGVDMSSFTDAIGSVSMDGSKAYIGTTPPYPQALLYYTLYDSSGNEVINTSGLVEQDGTGYYLNGSWSSDNVGRTMACTWGFDNAFDYGFHHLWKKTNWIPSVNDDGIAVVPPAVVTIDGTPTPFLGSWQTRDASTNYVRYDLDYGAAEETGPAFTAGDVAEYTGDIEADPTLPDVSPSSPVVAFEDYGYVGTNSPTPPNTDYAGVLPVTANGRTFNFPTGVTTEGTSSQLSAKLTGFANTSGVTTQVTVPISTPGNWYVEWYTTNKSVTVTGTVTGGSATTLVDTAQTFTTRCWGCTVSVTHVDTSVIPNVITATPFVINGTALTAHMLNLVADPGGAVVHAGDTYSVEIPDATNYVDTGTATTGGTTQITDSTRAGMPGSPWLDSALLTGQTLKILHDNGDGSQAMYKFAITSTMQGSGIIAFDAVDGQTVANGDLWEIDWPAYELNRWQDHWCSFKFADSSTVEVQAKGSDQNTLFMPSSSLVITDGDIAAGVTVTIEVFPPGSVLKRSSDNSRWLPTFGQVENRTDPSTGKKPAFLPNLSSNLPFVFDHFGLFHRITMMEPRWLNQMWAVLKTLTRQQFGANWFTGLSWLSPAGTMNADGTQIVDDGGGADGGWPLFGTTTGASWMLSYYWGTYSAIASGSAGTYSFPSYYSPPPYMPVDGGFEVAELSTGELASQFGGSPKFLWGDVVGSMQTCWTTLPPAIESAGTEGNEFTIGGSDAPEASVAISFSNSSGSDLYGIILTAKQARLQISEITNCILPSTIYFWAYVEGTNLLGSTFGSLNAWNDVGSGALDSYQRAYSPMAGWGDVASFGSAPGMTTTQGYTTTNELALGTFAIPFI